MRDRRPAGNNGNNLEMSDKLICAFTYIFSGMVGIIWLIINGIKKRPIKAFVRFHIFQSIFLWVIFSICLQIYKILFAFIVLIPLVNYLFGLIDFYLLKYPILMGHSIGVWIYFGFIALLAWRSYNGKHTEIPWITKTVRQLM